MAFITTIVTEDLIEKTKTYITDVVNPLVALGNHEEAVVTKSFFGLFTTTKMISPYAEDVEFIIEDNDLIGILSYTDLDESYTVYFRSDALELIRTIASFQGKGTIGLSDKEFATFNRFKNTDVDLLVLEVQNLKDSINA